NAGRDAPPSPEAWPIRTEWFADRCWYEYRGSCGAIYRQRPHNRLLGVGPYHTSRSADAGAYTTGSSFDVEQHPTASRRVCSCPAPKSNTSKRGFTARQRVSCDGEI